MKVNKPGCNCGELKRICKYYSDGNCFGNFKCKNFINEDRKFVEYFDDLYGQGLEVANWHMNGALEPFDNFYESAIEYAQSK